MRTEHLLPLYPRAWRDRYGAEFLATLEPGSLHPQQAIDIVSGAIDAWLSADVRRAAAATRTAPSTGEPAMLKSLMVCEPRARYTKRDGLIGAGVMLLATLVITLVGIAARRGGFPVTGEVMTSISFPVSLNLSMPFWLMKGQPWRAQAVILGGTTFFLIVIGFVASAL